MDVGISSLESNMRHWGLSIKGPIAIGIGVCVCRGEGGGGDYSIDKR